MPDIFDKLAGSPDNGQPPAPPQTPQSQGDIFDRIASQPVETPSTNAFAIPAGTPNAFLLTDAEPSIPAQSQGDIFDKIVAKPVEHDTTMGERFSNAWNDPSKGFLGRVWSVLNTPAVDIDSAFGRSSSAGGFEKGANDIASGLTSPLSIALAIGTLGAGSLVETGGMSALRAAGMAAPEVADVVKGAQILNDAAKAGKTAAEGYEAAEEAGVSKEVLSRGLQTLSDAALDSSSLLSKGLARNAGTALASKLGLSAKTADTVGQGLQALTSAGFTVQQAQQAAELSPRVLDALRDGDYETAKRLAVDVLGSGALAAVSAHEFAKESSPLVSTLGEKAGLNVQATPANVAVRDVFGNYDKNVAEAGRTNELWAQDLRAANPKMTPVQQERIRYYVESGLDPDVMAQRRNLLAEAAGRERPENGQSGNPITSGMTPERLQEVVGQENVAAKYTPKEIDSLLDAYDPSKLSDADKQIAEQIRDKQNATLEFAQKNNALKEGVDNYVTSLWKPEDVDNPAANRLKHDASTGQFATNTSMARQRIFDNAFEGQLFGKKLAETDPITLAANNANSFARVVEARNAVENLADEGAVGSDGRPLVTLSGNGSVAPDSDAVFVNPNARRNINIPVETVQSLKDSGDLSKLVDEGKIVHSTNAITPDNIDSAIDKLENSQISAQPKFDEEGNSLLRKTIQTLKDVRDGKLPATTLDEINATRPDRYQWNSADYGNVDHPALRDWNHIASTPSGDVLMKSDMLVHPEAREYLERRLGVDSQGLGDNPIGKAALKINSEAKGLTLSLSPFHIVQIGMRSLGSGDNPFRLERWDLANDPVLAKGVEHGLTLKQYANRAAFADGTLEGHSKILDKTPVIGQLQNRLNHFLFQDYIPAMKAQTYKSLVKRYAKAYPDWTSDKAAAVAADDANSRFGGINYKRLGRAAATQNWSKLVTLAPDWLESELRSSAKPFGTEGKIARQDLLRVTAGLWMFARVANMLVSGKMHTEAPFGVVYRKDGRDDVISIRTLPGDLLHLMSDPGGFAKGRISPILRTGIEAETGRDSFGRKLSGEDLASDIVHSQLPIPTQAIGKALAGTGPELGSAGQIANALGFTNTIYRSEANKLASQIASDHSDGQPLDPAQLARHQRLIKLEDSVRSGQTPLAALAPLRVSGQLPEADYKRLITNYKKTRGMSAEQAQLYTRASRVPAADLLRIWDVATPSERTILHPLILSKGKTYIKQQMKEATPQDRLADPVLRRYMLATTQQP